MTSKCKVLTISKASEVPLQPVDGKPTLVYWDIVGIANPLRMAMALSGEEWCDVRIMCGRSEDAKANKKEWFQAKPSLREANVLDFPNLPYYLEDGDYSGAYVRLTQSDAILRYLGNKYNLMGKQDSVPQHVVDMLLEEARDLDDELIRLSYFNGAEAVAKWLSSDELREKLNVWENYIRKSGAFVLGTSLTVVDLRLYTFLYKFQHTQAALVVSVEFDYIPTLPFFVPAYLEQVATATPQLEAYLKGPDMQLPINNPHARFDNF